MKSISNHSFLLAAFVMAAFSACIHKKPCPEPKPPDRVTKVDFRGESSKAAATKGLEDFKRISSSPETFAIGGFVSVDEVKLAQLGNPVQSITLSCKSVLDSGDTTALQSFIQNRSSLFPVEVRNPKNDKRGIRSAIYIDSIVDSTSKGKPYLVSQMGDANLVPLFDTAITKFSKDPLEKGVRESFLLVKIPGAQAILCATGLSEKDMVFPVGLHNALPCIDTVRAPMTWGDLRRRLSQCTQLDSVCADNSNLYPSSGPATPAQRAK